MDKIYLVYREVSDQYGTDKIAAACSTAERAKATQSQIRRHRSYIKEIVLDAPLDTEDR